MYRKLRPFPHCHLYNPLWKFVVKWHNQWDQLPYICTWYINKHLNRLNWPSFDKDLLLYKYYHSWCILKSHYSLNIFFRKYTSQKIYITLNLISKTRWKNSNALRRYNDLKITFAPVPEDFRIQIPISYVWRHFLNTL